MVTFDSSLEMAMGYFCLAFLGRTEDELNPSETLIDLMGQAGDKLNRMCKSRIIELPNKQKKEST